jgi:predicted PurR-regulated permease PerM
MAEQINFKEHSKYFFLAMFIILVGFGIWLIWPFITALLGSLILAYIFYPVYERLLLIIKNKNIASFLISLLIVILLVFPFIFVANAILSESTQIFHQIGSIDAVVDTIEKEHLSKYITNVDMSSQIKSLLNKFMINIMQGTEKFIISLPEKLLSFFIMLFTMFCLFKDGKKWADMIKQELPLKEKYRRHLSRRFNETIYATLYGIIVTAFIQGAVGALGFYLFNISSPILWGLVMIILAMLPFVGAAFIWLPAGIIKIAAGDVTNGVGILLYGLLIISTIDNLLRPSLIGSRGRIHPVLVLLGVLGGLQIFGLIGLIIGPLALALLVVFVELYISEKYET